MCLRGLPRHEGIIINTHKQAKPSDTESEYKSIEKRKKSHDNHLLFPIKHSGK